MRCDRTNNLSHILKLMDKILSIRALGTPFSSSGVDIPISKCFAEASACRINNIIYKKIPLILSFHILDQR